MNFSLSLSQFTDPRYKHPFEINQSIINLESSPDEEVSEALRRITFGDANYSALISRLPIKLVPYVKYL